MRVEALRIAGAVLLVPEEHEDDRGSFRRVLAVEDLRLLGLDPHIDQVSAATNRRAGTIRGMHYQTAPHEESKTLWCSAGAVFDVLVDLRPEQPTYGEWLSVQLSADAPSALHVPPGVAHGYQTLEDDSEMVYLISTPHVPASSRSLSWQDPTLRIEWPLPVTSMSQRDREAPPWPPQR